MKTNQNLIRKMGEFDVTQRTQDGMFNANALLQQWNKKNGNTRRRMDDFLDSQNTKAFIETIKEQESEGRNFAIPDNQIVTKGRARTLSSGLRKAADIWMHPFLFIDFAMWLNPKFKYDVLKFVYDDLIKFRNDAGTAYIEMCEQVASISNKKETADNIKKVAQAINFIAQNKHEKMIRNEADEDQMKEYVRVQKEITMLIKRGFIKSFDALMNHLRKEWAEKHQPKILTA